MEAASSWRTWGTWAAAVLVLGSAVSCDRSAAQGPSGPARAQSAPTVDPATDRTPVSGTTTCTRSEGGSRTRGGREILEEHFSCVDEMSDPRVSGSDEIDVETVFRAGDDKNLAAPWTAELVLSNEGGTWRGTCTGALERTTSPLGWPTNYGICTLAGEGAYEDLSYTYLLAGGNSDLQYAGWIEPGEGAII